MKWLVIGLLFAVYIFETVVAVLNRKSSTKPIPPRLKDVYDEGRYQKWLAYSLELHNFGLLRRGFNLIVLIFLLLRFLPSLEEVVGSWTSSPILQTLYFLAVYQSLLILIGLPFRIFATFSIEERHGFNRTTKRTFVKDTILGFALTLVLGGLIVAGINFLYLRFAANLWSFIALTWVGISVLMVLLFTVLNKVFLRLFNKFTPLPAGSLRSRIEKLAADVGFNVTAISVMDASKRSTKTNAAFTGIGKTREVILFDTLLEKMSAEEILAVLAHELGHAVHKDTTRMLVFQIGMAAFFAAGIGLILQNPAFFTAFGFSGIHFGFSLILFSILLQPVTLILGIPLNIMMRKREYRADHFAAELTEGAWLISALKTLARENLANLNPHPLAVLLYHSHPPLNERIKALQ
ncbi:MAG TPA: M48 family metallopeptidase [Firmicutes bacterium]|nr:M48 family metallopeptidase [Bacillota bacterium]